MGRFFLAMVIVSIAIIATLRRWRPSWPGILIAVVFAAVASSVLALPVETIGSRFGGIPRSLPEFVWPNLSWDSAQHLVIPTITIALLGAIESLLCARVADNLTTLKRHDPNQELMAQGINAEVIDLRTLRPLDKATVLESLKRTNRMVVVEEGWPTCSISSEIIAIAMTEGFDDLDAPVMRVTDVDVPLPYAANLEKMALIKASQVVEAVKAVTYR